MHMTSIKQPLFSLQVRTKIFSLPNSFTTERLKCHPKYQFPPGRNITYSKSHWSTEETMLQHVNSIILPYISSTRKVIDQKVAATVVIMDNFWEQLLQDIVKCSLLCITLVTDCCTKAVMSFDLNQLFVNVFGIICINRDR